MLGAFKLNSIARYLAPSQVSGARSSAANFVITGGTPSVISSNGNFTGYISYDQDEYSTVTVYPSNTNFYFNSSNAWTLEWWWKKTGTWTSTSGTIWLPDGLGTQGFSIEQINSTQYTIWISSTQIYTGTFPTSWQHFAIVSNGSSNLKVFVNGSQVANVSYTRSDSKTKFQLSTNGHGASATLQFDELRISNSARYTSGFTPSASAFTDDTNTLALFHFDTNTTDDTANSLVYRVPLLYTVENSVRTGSAKIGSYSLGPASTTTSELGFSTSMVPVSKYFNASTICCYEFWFKATLDADRKLIFWSTNSSINNMSYTPPDQENHMILFQDGNNFKLNYFRQFYPVTLGSRDSNWHHLAVQSNGNGYITVWYDGTQVVNYNVSSWTQRNKFYHCMGYFNNSTPVSGNSVYFDEIVITHGAQKYTPGNNFTPYTTAQVNGANTIGLFHCESTSQTDDTSS